MKWTHSTLQLPSAIFIYLIIGHFCAELVILVTLYITPVNQLQTKSEILQLCTHLLNYTYTPERNRKWLVV